MSRSDKDPGGGTTQPIQPKTAPRPTPPAVAGTPWLLVGGAFVLLALVMLGLGFLLGSGNNGDDEGRLVRETVIVQPPANDAARLTEVARSNNLATENAVLQDQLRDSQQLAATLDVQARAIGEAWDAGAATIRALEGRVAETNFNSTPPPTASPDAAPSIVATATRTATQTASQTATEPPAGPTTNPVTAPALNPGDVVSAAQPGVVYPYILDTDGEFERNALEAGDLDCGRIQGRIEPGDAGGQTFTVRWRHSPSNRSGSISTASSETGPGAFNLDIAPDELGGVYTITLQSSDGATLAAPVSVRFPQDCGRYELRLRFVPRSAG